MKGQANISISNVDDLEGEKITLSYFVRECGSLDSAKEIKSKIDDLVEEAGGETTSSTNSKE